MDFVTGFFKFRASETVGAHIEQNQVVVGSSSDESMTTLHQLVSESLSIGFHLFTVIFELWGGYLFKLSCKSGNLVVVRSSLEHGENCKIYFFIQTNGFAGEDHA